ncbi:MAG TPA: aminopeptidase P family N-terminal domain-containing protein, partial [Dongiaceae bacterium]
MNEQPRRPLGPQPWETVRTILDQSLPFANMRDTPYYRDAVYEQFSKKEYARRYAALRTKMREAKLDCIIAAGGPSHWSFGGGMLWLTGHWEWHALAAYVLVPLDGEPTMIYSMGGTHAEAVRRQVAVAVEDVRHSRNGQYAQVMVERLRELKLERGRIGLMEIDPRHSDYMPVNQYNVLKENLPDAELVFTKGFLHELVSIHSAEELACVRKAGTLCQNAMQAMVARAKPGAKEYELRAAAGAAILDGGGDIDFLIIGSTPMDDPAMIFGNPRPSG